MIYKGDRMHSRIAVYQPAVMKILRTGFTGRYYNLPEDHLEVGGAITGIVPGDSPFNHDWYDEQYLAFERIDQNLTFGNSWFHRY